MLNGSTTVVQFFTGGNMTSVLPAWKLELIQKKKLKEQGERQKLEDERSRKVFIPEWKRSLLEKKKEGANDSPETKEQAQSVNSVFGPRIIRKASEKTIAIVNASQRPDAKVDDGKLCKKKVFEDNETRNHSPLYSSPADSNSCVTNVVEIPTEEEQKPNKCGSLQREAKDYRESTQRGGALLKDDSKTPVSRYAQSTGLNSFKTKVDSEPVKTPSVLSYKRMFEQSKAEKNDISDLRIVKGTDNMKGDVRSDERIAESKLFAANDESQLQTLNKATEHNAQSIHMEKSTSLNVRKTVPSISPKPFKNFVSTPPWLRNSSSKSVSFPAGKDSVQETMVGNINNEVESISKDIHKSDHNSVVIKTSDVMQKGREDVNHSGMKIPEPVRENFIQPDYKNRESPSLQDPSVQSYSVVKQSEVKEKQRGVKSVKGNESQKYVVITGGNRPEFAPLNEKLPNDVNRDDASQVPNGQESQKDSHESSDDCSASQSSIASLRSLFGPSVGFRKHTSSEENLAVKVNDPEPTEHGNVLRRPGQNRRTQPSTVRWSADVLSLMSQPSGDEDDDNKLMILPQSDSKIPSLNNSQAKRPPPPTKRWTADVLSVVSQLDENDLSNLSPRSDSNRTFSPSSSLDRGRSSSLSDIREEQAFAYFQHKPNVSQGIEHRMHKLIRKASVSEINIDPDENESDSVSGDELSGLNVLDLKSSEAPNAQGTINDEIADYTLTDSTIKRKDSQLDLSSTEQEIQPVFARKRSVSHDIEQRVSELFHRQLSQQSDQDGADTDDEKNLEDESNIIIDQVVEIDQRSDPEKLFSASAAVKKPTDFASPSSEEESKGDSDHVVQESKPSKGSVHKLSALFGSSIWKGNKKDKNGLEEKPKIKPSVEVKRQKVPATEQSSQNQLLQKKEDNKKSSLFSKSQKKEDKSVEKKEKDQSSVNRFSWLKKISKSEQQYEGSKLTDVPGKKQKNNGLSSTDTASITAHKLGPVQKAGELEEEIASSKHEGAEEKSGENKIISVERKTKKNNGFIPTTEGVDTVLGAAHSLRPVRKSGKVEQTLVGKLKIISNASYEQAPPKGVYHKPKSSFQPRQDENKKLPAEVQADSKEASSRNSGTHIPVVVTQHWNGHQESPESEKSVNEAVPVSSIDEVPVSAIDIPETGESDVIVSVIDVPSSPDVHSTEKFLNGSNDKAVHVSDDISVSVIDLPSPVAKEDKPNTFQGGHLEADEFSDESDTDEVEGSYDFATGEVTHLVNGNIGSDDDDDDEEENDDDDEDEDVPVSYIGSAPQYRVPQVVFDSEPVELKSCLSPKTARRKVKGGKISFKNSPMVHDYPSEEAAKAIFDELEDNNNGQLKTLQNYQPAAVVNMEKKLVYTVQGSTQSVSNGEEKVHDSFNSKNDPEIKYTDDGQGFTDSTDYASALLF